MKLKGDKWLSQKLRTVSSLFRHSRVNAPYWASTKKYMPKSSWNKQNRNELDCDCKENATNLANRKI